MSMDRIPFNKPFTIGSELRYIEEAISALQISGNGKFTKKCHRFFEEKYGFPKCLLTTSCSDALEMSAILINTRPGDEIIIPSYNFVSSANAFLLRGASIVFADSREDHPNIDVDKIEELVSEKTKAIVVTHYAGMACDMKALDEICQKHQLYLIEDAAQAIDNTYDGKPLGSFGDLATFSFHETKNVICGEGGMLVINNPDLIPRSEIVWEKGTNRSAFFRGEIDKYGWVDLGSSFLPSEINAAYLYAQLESITEIQLNRKRLWDNYYNELKGVAENGLMTPSTPPLSGNNGHLFFLVVQSEGVRGDFIRHMNSKGIKCVFHYQSLHLSSYYRSIGTGRSLLQCEKYSSCLVRLPLYHELSEADQERVINHTKEFFT